MNNKILLFDIDDTLITSDACVYVLNRKNKVVRKLTSNEYNSYVLKKNEHYDFRDFDNPEILRNARFTKYWNILLKEYIKGNKIGIVTAREDKEMIYNFLLENGVDIEKRFIFAVGSKECRFSGKIEDKKRQVVEHLSARGYDTFVFFDDNINNLTEAKKMENKIGVNVQTIQAV